MLNINSKAGYSVDSSFFIQLKNNVPINHYPSVWNKIKDYIDSGRFISPQPVYDELMKRSDDLNKWLSKNKDTMFTPIDDLLELTKQISKDYSDLIESTSDTEVADPYVIALAIKARRNVLTIESKLGKVNIPYVCDQMNVPCVKKLGEFYVVENWNI
ncbi:DUF4411 family protein [Candidatus Roizmanbacteria bacterium]|nr:DUF4411 family protein [Candidatus Roizmanbacteria bacterium]